MPPTGERPAPFATSATLRPAQRSRLLGGLGSMSTVRRSTTSVDRRSSSDCRRRLPRLLAEGRTERRVARASATETDYASTLFVMMLNVALTYKHPSHRRVPIPNRSVRAIIFRRPSISTGGMPVFLPMHSAHRRTPVIVCVTNATSEPLLIGRRRGVRLISPL